MPGTSFETVLDVARWLVDMNVPREKLVRLAHGMTPAKLADVV